MKNKKGFTLIELLAVIVILSIIMVIAVPQILNVIDSSRSSAWKNSVGMVKRAIISNTSMIDPSSSNEVLKVKDLCSNISNEEYRNKILKTGDTNITCSSTSAPYVFNLQGKDQFNGKSATITCTEEGKCTEEISNSSTQEVRTYFIKDGYTVAENPIYLTAWYSQTTRYDAGKGVYFNCNSSSNYTGYIFSENKINISNYKKLGVKYKFTKMNGRVDLFLSSVHSFRNAGEIAKYVDKVPTVGEEETFEIDISDITGEYYITFDTPATVNEGYVTDFYLVNK